MPFLSGVRKKRYRLAIVLLVALLALAGVFAFVRSRQDGRVRVACMGDSITYGSTLPNQASESYPAVLGALLGAQAWDVQNFGMGGATLLNEGDRPYRRSDAFARALAFEPAIVVVMLGTNDAKPYNFAGHDRQFVEEYVDLVEELRRLPSKPRVLVATPPPAFPGRWAIDDAALARDIQPRVVEVVRRTGAELVDIRSALHDAEALFPDTVHPNATGARRIAEVVRAAIVRPLAASGG